MDGTKSFYLGRGRILARRWMAGMGYKNGAKIHIKLCGGMADTTLACTTP